ncbi:MAG: O-methyltransferase [Pseudomonadota bacterium]
MSGASIPYHLRQNKAIDRGLYLDLLSRVGRYRNISDYTYIGFGGPFLEDFKYVHAATRISKMISIEIDANAFKRQKFNKPISCIDLRHESSGEFISNFEFDDDYVIWLDYTEPTKVGEQLAELEMLISKIPEGSIFKITLNAHAASLGTPNDGSDLQKFRSEKAQRLLGDYAPATITRDDVTANAYPRLLLSAAVSAAKKGIAGRSRCIVQPLTAFTYKDGQSMLTMTGAVIKSIDASAFLASIRIAHWPFSSLDWSVPLEISVPEMSFKERMHIESLLPQTDAATIGTTMGYYIGASATEAAESLGNFVMYYRLYPWYSRVSL